MRLLLVEDDAMIGAAARQGLRQEGHVVDGVRDGREAAAAAVAYDLMLLDLGLPKRDGLAVLRALRAKGRSGGMDQDQVIALRRVAPDYPLELVFVEKQGRRERYLTDMPARIVDELGRVVFEGRSEGTVFPRAPAQGPLYGLHALGCVVFLAPGEDRPRKAARGVRLE